MIPAAVRFQAENLFAVTPEPPSELPVELIRNDRYCLFLTPIPTLSFVERIRVDEADVEATVHEVRELLRARGRAQSAWSIAPGATPSRRTPPWRS